MADHDGAMLAYVKLAELSHKKRQLLGRDKFLLLAAAAACRAGWPEVADGCRELVLTHNASHLVGRFERFTEAMRSADFQPLLKQLERFCGYERAEHLLSELGIALELPRNDLQETPGQHALDCLDAMQASDAGA